MRQTALKSLMEQKEEYEKIKLGISVAEFNKLNCTKYQGVVSLENRIKLDQEGYCLYIRYGGTYISWYAKRFCERFNLTIRHKNFSDFWDQF